MLKNKKIFYIDIDGVICNNTYGDYKNAKPYYNNIKKINKLYNKGHNITIWTARGTILSQHINEIKHITINQLIRWKVKYSDLIFGKPYYDYIIDDRCCNNLDEYVKKFC